MNSKLKTALTIIITAAVTFSATSVIYSFKNSTVADDRNKDLALKINAVNTYIDKHYLYDNIDYGKLNDEAVRAYVDALEEPYTHYYTQDEFQKYMSGVEESYTGIGVVIAADTEKDMILVLSPFVDSPAYKAGMLPGDYIIAVDGVSYTAVNMQECVDHITGGVAGTKVTLDILRDNEPLTIDVVRGEITENSVSSEMLYSDIGYISITNFNMSTDGYDKSTYTEFVDEITNLTGNGMKKLIIDLRDNPGGVMEEVINIADCLLPKGIITYTETRTGERDEYMSDANEVKIPMVVLVNGNSASASEILTGALKDYGYAVVVGEKTYGKGIVQRVYPFTDGAGMSMTVAKYFTPNGVCIHEVGIEPDYVVELPEKYDGMYAISIPHEEDTQLQKAIELLEKN